MIFLEHPPVITVGRRTETDSELQAPETVEVGWRRGPKRREIEHFHGPGQLVCYPILDLANHGKDVKRYVRDLEDALMTALAAFDLDAERSDRVDRSLEISLRAMVRGHEGRVDRRPRHALGNHTGIRPERRPRDRTVHGVGSRRAELEDAAFTTMRRELGRPVTVADVRPVAVAAIGEVYDLELEELPTDGDTGLWPQRIHATLAER